MAQKLKTLGALPEDPHGDSQQYVMLISGGLMLSSGAIGTRLMWYTDTQAGKTLIHIKLMLFKKLA